MSEEKNRFIDKIYLKRCTYHDHKIRHNIINHLQKEADILLAQGKSCGSFWFNLDTIIVQWNNDAVYVALLPIDSTPVVSGTEDTSKDISEDVICGYIISDVNSPSPQIDILEVFPEYRGKGIGRFIVEEWEKMFADTKLKLYPSWNGNVSLYSVDNSLGFWLHMGYMGYTETSTRLRSKNILCHKVSEMRSVSS